MPDINRDRKKLLNLGVGQECVVNWFQESGGLVTRNTEGTVTLEEVFGYGAHSILVKEYEYTKKSVEEILQLCYSWT